MKPQPGKPDPPAPTQLAVRFVASLDADRRLYKHDIAGSIAHARMLETVGLITTEERARIEQGLKQIEVQIDDQGDAWPGWRPELEDVHMCVEAALIKKIGDAARKLHTGRSRNDQVATDLTLWIQGAGAEIASDFALLYRAFVGLADRDGRIVMPSYTHLQRAQPIVVGGELMAWLAALKRAERRLVQTATDLQANPLGSGAIAGSSLPLDRDLTSRSLGLGPPAPSSIDATANRDLIIDFVYALAMTALTLSRWAEQWIIYLSREFGFLRMADAYTTGSSMMPQKRNPDVLELVRGRCGTVYGHLVALLTICKGLPIGYSRDLQETKPHLFAAHDVVADCLKIAAGVVASATFDAARISDGLDKGFLDATSLAEYLVTKNIPFRTAHQIVGRLVRACEDKGYDCLSRLSLDELNTACGDRAVCGQDVYDWLGAQNVANRYQTSGNAGLSGFEKELAVWKKRLDKKDR